MNEDSKCHLDFLPEEMMVTLHKIRKILISDLREIKKNVGDENVEIGWTT